MMCLPSFGDFFLHLWDGLGFKFILLVLWGFLVLYSVVYSYLPCSPTSFQIHSTLSTHWPLCPPAPVFLNKEKQIHWKPVCAAQISLLWGLPLEHDQLRKLSPPSQYLTVASPFASLLGWTCMPSPPSRLAFGLPWSGTGFVLAVTVAGSWQCSCSAVSWRCSSGVIHVSWLLLSVAFSATIP